MASTDEHVQQLVEKYGVLPMTTSGLETEQIEDLLAYIEQVSRSLS